MDNVYPAADYWDNRQITVAGTQNCFSEPWAYSNGDPNYVDIAAEGHNILAFNGTDYEIVHGTSYSAAFVTGAAAQLAARCKVLNPQMIKRMLLKSRDRIPALDDLSGEGNSLDVSRAIALAGLEDCQLGAQSGRWSQNVDKDKEGRFLHEITSSPNPFSSRSMVRIPVNQTGGVQLMLYNLMGQPVTAIYQTTAEKGDVVEWETPADLVPGVYMLRVQVGEEIYQETLVKQ